MLSFDDIIDSSFRFISAHGNLINTEIEAFALNYILLEIISPH